MVSFNDSMKKYFTSFFKLKRLWSFLVTAFKTEKVKFAFKIKINWSVMSFMCVLGAWFFRPILNLLRWLGVKPLGLTHQNSIKIFVKISEGSENVTVPMDLPKDWTVGHVKEYLVCCFDCRLNYSFYSFFRINRAMFRIYQHYSKPFTEMHTDF